MVTITSDLVNGTRWPNSCACTILNNKEMQTLFYIRRISFGWVRSHCTWYVLPNHFPTSSHFIYSYLAPSAPPQEVACVSISSTTIRVSWVPPPAQSRNGVITQYSVAYQAVEGEDTTKHVVEGIGHEHSSWEISNLEKWREYKVWVRAHTDVGPGPESIPVSVRTDEDGRFWCMVKGNIYWSLQFCFLGIHCGSQLYDIETKALKCF